jgi:hypothetical protein
MDPAASLMVIVLCLFNSFLRQFTVLMQVKNALPNDSQVPHSNQRT